MEILTRNGSVHTDLLHSYRRLRQTGVLASRPTLILQNDSFWSAQAAPRQGRP